MSFLQKFNDRPRWRWLACAIFVILWTTALVLPFPDPGSWPVQLTPSRKFLIAKTCHVSAYALMTILCGWLRVPVRFRLLLLFFLMAHAAATEWIQLNISNRTGTVDDVVLDHLGIAIGLAVSWKWWSKKEAG